MPDRNIVVRLPLKDVAFRYDYPTALQPITYYKVRFNELGQVVRLSMEFDRWKLNSGN